MCACVHACVSVCMCACMCPCVCMHAGVCVRAWVYVHVCMCVRHVCKHPCTSSWVYRCMLLNACRWLHAFIHVCIHACVHMHTCMRMSTSYMYDYHVSGVWERQTGRKHKQHCLACFSAQNETLRNVLPLPGKTVQPGRFPGFVLRACGSHCTCPAGQPPCEQSAAASYCQCQGCPLLTDHKVTGVRSNQRFYSLQEFCGVRGTSTILWLYNYYFWGFNVCILVELVKCSVLTLVSEIWHYRNYRCYYFEFYESHLFWLLQSLLSFSVLQTNNTNNNDHYSKWR